MVIRERIIKIRGSHHRGPRKTQNFKMSGTSSSSSSGGFSATGQRRGGRFSGGPRFQRQRDSGSTVAPLCRRCNNRHFGECRRGSSACFTCGQMGHRAVQCPQNQQRSQPPFLPPPVPLQQVLGPSGYTQAGRGSAYHYQGDIAPYTGGQYQYPHDPYQQGGYTQYSGGYTPYQPFSAGGSQWNTGGQSQNLEVASSSAGSSRQPSQPSRGAQGRGNQAGRGRGGRQQAQGRIHHITLHDAQNHPDLIMGTLNILGHFARVLIDCGATHSVISHTFAQLTQPHSTPLGTS